MNPLIDLYWHSPTEYLKRAHPFFDYVWDGIGPVTLESLDMHPGSVLLMVFGMDAAINCHLGLVNTYSTTIVYDNFHADLLHRSQDPGAGAFAPYMSESTRVANPIPSGGELFKLYGDDWFVLRSQEFGLVSLSNDYNIADGLIRKFQSLFPEIHDTTSLEEIHVDLWDLMANFPYESRVTNAIPKNRDDILAAIKFNIWEPYVTEARRTINDLLQTGRCLDNISHGSSTLKQAGRGAFSTTALLAGSVITGSPLLHINTDKLFQMLENVHEELGIAGNFNGSTTKSIHIYQPSLNYCWKHPQSTMLLCPYGAGVNFINHNQTLANVKIQWAPHGHIGHDSNFLGLSFSDIFKSNKVHLAFDWVALRDIQEGEELFLDYGDSWERAWQEHVSAFQKYAKSESSSSSSTGRYRSAYALNREIDNADIRTKMEQQSEPYPRNVELRCNSRAVELAWLETESPEAYVWDTIEIGLPCQVLERKKALLGVTVYDVTVTNTHGLAPAETVFFGTSSTVVPGIPRSGLKFFDHPYTTDLHLPSAFRQPVEIPDELFPEAWKNQPT